MLRDFKVLTFDVVGTLIDFERGWIESRHGMKDSGGTIEAEHTTPDYHFRTLAELADAVETDR